MNQHTLVAVYDTSAHAAAAVRDLKAANVPADAIQEHAKNGGAAGATTGQPREQGFWSKLFGGDSDHDSAVYDRSIEEGGSVVTVRAPETDYDRISAILEHHNPIDLDERAAQYGGSAETTTTRTTNAAGVATGGAATADALRARETGAARGTATGTRGTAMGDDKMQLSEENLAVGKRAIQGGTTRIRKYVVDTPVEEQVSLHSDKVTMDRRPVTDGRPVGDASFRDQAIEMTERGEEAVVSKTARVKEEIGLRREGSDRTETVKDNVRREDVKIEQVPGGRSAAGRPTPASPAQRSQKV